MAGDGVDDPNKEKAPDTIATEAVVPQPPPEPTVTPIETAAVPAETTTTAEATAQSIKPAEKLDSLGKPLPKRKTLSIGIRDRAVLYAAYMSFLKYGGLFIPTKKSFTMSEQCILIITLPNDTEKYTVNGKVVWITPPGAQDNKAGGIGIEFADDRDGDKLRRRIEEILGPLLQSNNITHTM